MKDASQTERTTLNAQQQISRFQEFFEKFYYAKLLEQVQKGDSFLVFDFRELSSSDPELADVLLEQPEETLRAAELAVKEFDLPREVKQFHVRVKDLPQSSKMLLREVRSKHLGRFVWSLGVVRQKSDVRPQVTSARFECPSCGNVITVLQIEKKFREPSKCSCGRKGKFKELSKELIDAQGIVLEEASEDLEGGDQPKRMNIFLKNDLVSPLNEKRCSPGNKVKVAGWITEVPTNLKDGGKSTKFDLLYEANFIESVEEDFTDIKISKEDEEQIKEIANDPNVFERLVKSMAPSIYGHEKTKEALILQFVGGVRKERADGTITRGDMHVLLVGDPGCGKSQMLKRATKIAPKARYVTGKGVSGAGLCVSPNSILITNPGDMIAIQKVVEPISGDMQYREGVWKKDATEDVKIQTLSYDLKVHSAKPASLWKLKTPQSIIEVQTASGKKVELTGNTQLLTCVGGELKWIKSNEVKTGAYIATPRRLMEGKVGAVNTVDLIESNPVVHNVKKSVKEIVDKLTKKYGSIRTAARRLNIKENQLYFHWVNEKARGNIKLKELLRLANIVEIDVKQLIRELSLYNGKVHKIPQYINENVLYAAGLIAGDGDIRKSGETYSIRLSNATPELQNRFREILINEFDLKYDVQQGNEKRPEATRTHSKILKEVFSALGIPESPKSQIIKFSPILLKMNNQLLAHYIAGMYDTDGCINVRKTKGSHSIEYYTCSEQFARQLQFILLRYSISSKIRNRPPTTGEIKGKYERYNIEIRGRENIRLFEKNIPLHHPKKKENIEKIYSKEEGTPNLDIIPGAGLLLKRLLKEHNIKNYMHIKDTIRRGTAQKLTALLTENEKTQKIKELANSDISWEKVTEITAKSPEYEYVYDVTVEGTHNFVVDGIIVHNTAAVVKDEFLGGWSLEAGALVLSNRGFVMIDEMDKMGKEDRSAMHEALEQQSYHYDTEIMFADGSTEKMGTFVNKIFENNKEKISEGIDCEIVKCDLPEILTTDFKQIFPIKINRVSRHKAPDYFYKIKYSNGRIITVTPEHPLFIFKEGSITTIPAEKAQPEMFAPAPKENNESGEIIETEECLILETAVKYIRITSVEKMTNHDQLWVYDVTVEPTHNFISENLILHNSVSISKANIQATLRAETTVLAAANPKLGRFNNMEPLAPQIDLPPTLINRFDLIFPVKDIPDKKRDELMADHILGMHQDPTKSKPEIPTDLLRKFVAYARNRVKPELSDEALEEIKSYYIKMRNQGDIEDVGIKSIPITARQLEALIRLAEASAKVRLSNKVTREDARHAIDLLEYCLNQVARDATTGRIDIDQISTGVSTAQRSKIIVIKELLVQCEEQMGKTIPVEDLIEHAKGSGITKEQVEEALEKLKRQGDIFEPKRGFVQRIT